MKPKELIKQAEEGCAYCYKLDFFCLPCKLILDSYKEMQEAILEEIDDKEMDNLLIIERFFKGNINNEEFIDNIKINFEKLKQRIKETSEGTAQIK